MKIVEFDKELPVLVQGDDEPRMVENEEPVTPEGD